MRRGQIRLCRSKAASGLGVERRCRCSARDTTFAGGSGEAALDVRADNGGAIARIGRWGEAAAERRPPLRCFRPGRGRVERADTAAPHRRAPPHGRERRQAHDVRRRPAAAVRVRSVHADAAARSRGWGEGASGMMPPCGAVLADVRERRGVKASATAAPSSPRSAAGAGGALGVRPE